MTKKPNAPRKPGRPPKGPYPGKSAALATRVSPELRAAIDEMARRAGRSLSQEVEFRLRSTFDANLKMDRREQLAQLFGGPENMAIFRLIAEVQATAEYYVTQEIEGKSWKDDPFVCKTFRHAADVIWKALGPRGEAVPPTGVKLPGDGDPEVLGEAIAWGALSSVQLADDEPPLAAQGKHYSNQMMMYPSIKRGLGELMKRLK